MSELRSGLSYDGDEGESRDESLESEGEAESLESEARVLFQG